MKTVCILLRDILGIQEGSAVWQGLRRESLLFFEIITKMSESIKKVLDK